MAVVTYTQQAALSQFQQWLMQQGALACQERQSRSQTIAPGCAGGATAQLGDSIRYTVRTSIASQVVTFSGRYVQPDGTPNMVMEQVTATSAGSPTRLTRPAAPGCYTNMVASFGGDTVTGTQVHVLAELGRTVNGIFVPFAVLLDGYSTSQDPLDMGIQNPNQTAQGGPSGGGGGGGCCVTSQVSDDMVGNGSIAYSAAPGAGQNLRILCIDGAFYPSATAGNRLVTLILDNGTDRLFTATGISYQVASTNREYHFSIGSARYATPANDKEYGPLPDIWFDSTTNVTLQAEGVKSGDSFDIWTIVYELRGP